MPGVSSSGSTSGPEHATRAPHGVSTARGFEQIGLACLEQVRANEAALRANDSEALHRMRVGLRRLRAAISLFKKLVRGAQTDAVKTELRWLTDQLSTARDLDVFSREVAARREHDLPHAAELARLEELLHEKRERAFAHARESVAGVRYERALSTTREWLKSGNWTRADRQRRHEARLERFARRVLRRRTAKLVEALARLEQLDDRERHRVRIGVKKLHYAAQFFSSVFPAEEPERRRFVKCLKKLQDALGDLNDISVHERLRPELLDHPAAPAPAAFALGLVIRAESEDVAQLTRAAAKSGTRLAKLAQRLA